MTLHTSSIVMQHLLAVAVQAAALAIIIGVIVFVFRGQLAPRWRHRLWWVVVVRLAIPVLPASPVSLYHWLPEPITTQQLPTSTEQSQASTPPSQARHHNAPMPAVGDERRTHTQAPSSVADSSTRTNLLAEPLPPVGTPHPATPTMSDPASVTAMPLPAPHLPAPPPIRPPNHTRRGGALLPFSSCLASLQRS